MYQGGQLSRTGDSQMHGSPLALGLNPPIILWAFLSWNFGKISYFVIHSFLTYMFTCKYKSSTEVILCKHFVITLWQLFNFEVKSRGNYHGNCIVWRPGRAASVKQIRYRTYEPSSRQHRTVRHHYISSWMRMENEYFGILFVCRQVCKQHSAKSSAGSTTALAW